MGRKRILDLASYKMTVDIEGKNKKILDEITQNSDIKYGRAINNIIETFLDMPEDVALEVKEFIFNRYCELNHSIEEEGGFDRPLRVKKRDYYLKLAKLLKLGKNIEPQEILMKKIPLKEGYLLCPRDWILLNPEDAKNSMYAGCVECRNRKKYGVPYMVFFCNYRYGNEYTDEFTEKINGLCEKVWPEFKEILKQQVPLIPGLSGAAKKTNEQNHLNAPIIGHFHFWEKGEIEDPPYGTMIVREEYKEE